jgi:hypothetical protein
VSTNSSKLFNDEENEDDQSEDELTKQYNYVINQALYKLVTNETDAAFGP